MGNVILYAALFLLRQTRNVTLSGARSLPCPGRRCRSITARTLLLPEHAAAYLQNLIIPFGTAATILARGRMDPGQCHRSIASNILTNRTVSTTMKFGCIRETQARLRTCIKPSGDTLGAHTRRSGFSRWANQVGRHQASTFENIERNPLTLAYITHIPSKFLSLLFFCFCFSLTLFFLSLATTSATSIMPDHQQNFLPPAPGRLQSTKTQHEKQQTPSRPLSSYSTGALSIRQVTPSPPDNFTEDLRGTAMGAELNRPEAPTPAAGLHRDDPYTPTPSMPREGAMSKNDTIKSTDTGDTAAATNGTFTAPTSTPQLEQPDPTRPTTPSPLLTTIGRIFPRSTISCPNEDPHADTLATSQYIANNPRLSMFPLPPNHPTSAHNLNDDDAITAAPAPAQVTAPLPALVPASQYPTHTYHYHQHHRRTHHNHERPDTPSPISEEQRRAQYMPMGHAGRQEEATDLDVEALRERMERGFRDYYLVQDIVREVPGDVVEEEGGREGRKAKKWGCFGGRCGVM
ncbi:hypothetical protein M011DRAFT_459015 [Sporormia fimetaria CBS 119925]|uniref:Uncharacterized protein n=1 Tax=Sporormia fimetaria CBS 119925 TaxID=1340428 RepID=A0A6A6VA49_9PLEO|nr:hypothetical protein M011DRAFT_459015 [Sporormia fimetaria CBS 119925]